MTCDVHHLAKLEEDQRHDAVVPRLERHDAPAGRGVDSGGLADPIAWMVGPEQNQLVPAEVGQRGQIERRHRRVFDGPADPPRDPVVRQNAPRSDERNQQHDRQPTRGSDKRTDPRSRHDWTTTRPDVRFHAGVTSMKS